MGVIEVGMGRTWRGERVAAVRWRGGERWRWSSLARLGARGEDVGLVRGRHLPGRGVKRELLVEPSRLVLVEVRREGGRMHFSVGECLLPCAGLSWRLREAAGRREEAQREISEIEVGRDARRRALEVSRVRLEV